MKRGKTKSGFSFTLDDKVFDDMELLESLVDIDKGNSAALPMVVSKILGKEQKNALYEHCRDDDGRVPVSKVGQELTEIFEAFGESKKS